MNLFLSIRSSENLILRFFQQPTHLTRVLSSLEKPSAQHPICDLKPEVACPFTLLVGQNRHRQLLQCIGQVPTLGRTPTGYGGLKED